MTTGLHTVANLRLPPEREVVVIDIIAGFVLVSRICHECFIFLLGFHRICSFVSLTYLITCLIAYLIAYLLNEILL